MPERPGKATIIEATQRAVRDAAYRGTTLFVAAGNESQDLPNKTVDPVSGEAVAKSCKYLPLELEGVVGVSGLGADGTLASYSSYGYGAIHVAAPGGDHDGGPVSGRILSTLPVNSYYYWAAAFWSGRFGTGCPAGLDLNANLPDYGTPLAPRLRDHLRVARRHVVRGAPRRGCGGAGHQPLRQR